MLKATLFFLFTTISCFLFAQEQDSDEFYAKAKEVGKTGNYRKAADFCLEGLKISPKNLDLTEYLGKSYLELGKLDSARYLLKKVVDARRNNETALKYLVNTEFTSKRYSSAVCYINELLQKSPYDKYLWIKKINIYDKMENREEAIRAVRRLKIIFPKDKKVKEIYNYFMLQKGDESVKTKNLDEAKAIYNQVLKAEPTNKSAFLALIKSELLSGDKQAALKMTERALISFPTDRNFIQKKIGILEELGKFDKAIVFAKKNNTKKELSSTLKYLVEEAASFYKNQDPYELLKKEYTLTGKQKTAVKIISTAIAKGQDDDAVYYIEKELKKNPSNKDILVLKLQFYSKNKHTRKYNNLLKQLYKKFPDDSEITEKYNLLTYTNAKELLIQQDYNEAINKFTYLSTQKEYKNLALENLFSIYQIRNNFDLALLTINKLISNTKKSNPKYLVKKSALLEKMGDYKGALAIATELLNKYPTEEIYKTLYQSQSESYVSFLMKDEQYQKALDFITESILVVPNPNLNTFAINASVAIGDLEKATAFGEITSELQPENKEISLKLADIYTNSKDYDSAIKTLNALKKKYPYSKKINGSLSEVLYKKGKELEKSNKLESAFNYYTYSIQAKSKNNPAVNSLSNLYINNKSPKEALAFINNQLKIKRDNALLYKKGLVFEKMGKLDSAYFYQKLYDPTIKEYENWNTRLNYLKFNSFKNELEFSYVNNSSDSVRFKSALASMKYTRFNKKNTYILGFSYLAKGNGVGLQLNLGWNHIFSKSIYTNVKYDISNQFFPKHKLSASVFKSFRNDYEVELGARYSMLSNDKNLVTGIVGVSKIFDRFWLNGKAFFLYDDASNFYNTIVVQARYFIENRDNISFIVATGTAPYDEHLGFQTNTFLSYVNSMVGVGYSKQFGSGVNIAINGTWNNYKVEKDVLASQLGISFSLRTRF